MLERRCAVAFVLAACVGSPPKEPCVEPDTTVVERAVLGEAIEMSSA